VLTVSLEVVPTLTLAGLTEHVGASATEDCTAHESVIDPLKPPIAVVVIAEVAESPGFTDTGVKADTDTLKSGGGGTKTASTTWVEFTVQTLAFVVVQGCKPGSVPDQIPNVDPPVGVAVNVTVVPMGNAEMQSVGQLMPLGLLVTVPVPVPVNMITTLKTGEVVAGSSKTTPQPEPQAVFPPVNVVPKRLPSESRSSGASGEPPSVPPVKSYCAVRFPDVSSSNTLEGVVP